MKIDINLHRRIFEDTIDSFESIMLSNNLTRVKAEPIIPKKDTSLLFTNSTIVPLKEIILDAGQNDRGYFVTQDCIRLRILNEIRDNKSIRQKVPVFRMIGSFIHQDDRDFILSILSEYLIESFCIKKDRLIVLIPENSDRDWIKISKAHGYKCRQTKSYTWNYGIDNCHGYGVAIAFVSSDSTTKILGNIVGIYRENRLIGYEFGFGVEALIGKGLYDKKPIDASHSYLIGREIYPNKNIDVLSNLISIVSVFSHLDIEKHDSKSRWWLRNKAFRLCAKEICENNISLNIAKAWIEKYNSLFLNSNVDTAGAVLDLNSLVTEILNAPKRFENFLKSQEALYEQRGLGVLKYTNIDDLKKSGTEMSVPEELISDLVLKYKPWSI